MAARLSAVLATCGAIYTCGAICGCSPTTVAPAPPISVSVAPAPPAPVAPPTIVEPKPLTEVGCELPPGEGQLEHSFDFVLQGRRFATLEGKLKIERLQLAPDGRRAFAVVDDGVVRLAAEIDPRRLRVGQREGASPIGGWLEVRAATITRAADGQASLAFGLPSIFEPTAPVPPVQISCLDLTPFTVEPPAGERVQLPEAARIPLSVTPGGAVFGHLHGPKPAVPQPNRGVIAVPLPDLFRLEEREGMVRLRLGHPQVAVVGWVEASALEEATSVGMLGMLGSASRTGPAKLVCARDVALEVAAEGARLRVGSLRAGKSVPADTQRDGTPRVVLDHPLSAFADALGGDAPKPETLPLVVAAADVAACQLTPR